MLKFIKTTLTIIVTLSLMIMHVVCDVTIYCHELGGTSVSFTVNPGESDFNDRVCHLITVKGTKQDEILNIVCNQNKHVILTVSGSGTGISAISVDKINVAMKNGNDIVTTSGACVGQEWPKFKISGGKGDDTLNGGGNDDLLNGQNGNDILHGKEGADTLIGGRDGDYLDGGDDSDYLKGLSGVDFLVGGLGVDVLSGGKGNDFVAGGASAWTHSTNRKNIDLFMQALFNADASSASFPTLPSTHFCDDAEADDLNGDVGKNVIVVGINDLISGGKVAEQRSFAIGMALCLPQNPTITPTNAPSVIPTNAPTLSPTAAPSEPTYVWALSDSNTTPSSNNGTFVEGELKLYLWLVHCDFPGMSDGISGAKFSLKVSSTASNDSNLVFSFNPSSGFLNLGDDPAMLELQLGATCPCGPIVVGDFDTVSITPSKFDFTENQGLLSATDCVSYLPHDIQWMGYSTDGSNPSCVGPDACSL